MTTEDIILDHKVTHTLYSRAGFIYFAKEKKKHAFFMCTERNKIQQTYLIVFETIK